MNQLVPLAAAQSLPAIVTVAGERAQIRFLEFFAAQIRNANTRRAYPIEDKAHARNAKARSTQAVNAGRMSKAEKAKIDKKADAVLDKG